jgi:hypothetical protein
VIISRIMRWAEHVARTGERRGYTGIWWGNLRGRAHLEDPGVDERIILNGSSGSGLGTWTGLIWLRIGACGGNL